MVDKSKFRDILACQLASSRYGVRLLNLISHVFAAGGHEKQGPFSLRAPTEVRLNFSFSPGRFLFSMHASLLLPVRGFREFLHYLHLFILFLFFLSATQSLRVIVDMGVMVMKEYSTLPRLPELESHHHMQFNLLSRTLNRFKYSYLTLIILFKININKLFAHSAFNNRKLTLIILNNLV